MSLQYLDNVSFPSHMGTSVVDPARGDIEKISGSLRQALHEAKTHKGS